MVAGGSRERRQGPEGAAGLFRPCHLADNPPVFVYFEEMITIMTNDKKDMMTSAYRGGYWIIADNPPVFV